MSEKLSMPEPTTTERIIFECELILNYCHQSRVLGEEITLLSFSILAEQRGFYCYDAYLNEMVTKFMEKKIIIPRLATETQKYLNRMLKAAESFDWESLTVTANKNNIEGIIKKHGHKIPDAAYWKLIAHIYTMANFCYGDADKIKRYFFSDRPDRHFLMDEAEQRMLAELPDTLTVYRGCSKKEIKSGKFRFSWTLEKKVAEFFAFDFINIQREKSFEKNKELYDVVEMTINKKDIVALFLGRKEAEIIYIPN